MYYVYALASHANIIGVQYLFCVHAGDDRPLGDECMDVTLHRNQSKRFKILSLSVNAEGPSHAFDSCMHHIHAPTSVAYLDLCMHELNA